MKKLIIVSDSANWILDYQTREIFKTMKRIGIETTVQEECSIGFPKVIHYTDQFVLQNLSTYLTWNKISIDYFHGKDMAISEFNNCYSMLKKWHRKISRIRVSNSDMERFVLSSGISRDKVFKIPIAINPKIFRHKEIDRSINLREKFGIPKNARVIGSFQKDGIGWGEGDEPKLIKGPDIFLKVIKSLNNKYGNIWVVLTGPSRGYVKKGLEKIGVPYVHIFLKNYEEIEKYYCVLDLYLISSRDEGGPMALLEAMASGVPVVTTNVGQAVDLVIDGKNAFMCGSEDVKCLTNRIVDVFENDDIRKKFINNGYLVADQNSFECHDNLWRKYFTGLLI